MALFLWSCGGAIQTRATDGDRLQEKRDYLKAVAYYDLALEKDIPSDHPQYEATQKKRRNALRDYANKEAGKSESNGDELALELRTILNTARDLDSNFDARKSIIFAKKFDSVLEELGRQALAISLPGKKLARLEYLSHLGIENNPASSILKNFRADALQRYELAIPGSGEYLRYLYLVASRHVELSRPMPIAPDIGLALSNSGISGSCTDDLGNAVIRTEGAFPVSYHLVGTRCAPSTRHSQKKATYAYVVDVPITVRRRVKMGETCIPKFVTRTQHYCAMYNSNGVGCAQQATRQVQESAGSDCTPNYESKTFTEIKKETRQAERLEKHVEERYELEFVVIFTVGSQEVRREISVSHRQTDSAYHTDHGSKTISLTNAGVRQACMKIAQDAISEEMAYAQSELGEQRFRSAQNDNDRALAALLRAESGKQWLLSQFGFGMQDISNIETGKRPDPDMPSSVATMPSIDKSFRPGGELGLKYADAWKGGTNLLLTEGGDLTLRAERTSQETIGAFSAQYESRTGIADFRYSWLGMLRATRDSPSDNLGWGLGYRVFMGSYDSSTSAVYTIGLHYEQHKEEKSLSFRTVSFDYTLYYPISRYLSLDAGVELNVLKLFELAEKWGAGSSIDHGSPAWLGASLYLGRNLSLGLHHEVRWFSDVGGVTLLSVSARH